MLIDEAIFRASENAKPSNPWVDSVSASDSDTSITAVSASETGVVLPEENGDMSCVGGGVTVRVSTGAARIGRETVFRSDGIGGNRL